jgi:hypothetical protein
MTRVRYLVALGMLVGTTAGAQPITSSDDATQHAELGDAKQLAAALTAIGQDPGVHVDDPRARADAQALLTEGFHQLRLRAYDQALANFLEAYARFPSPRILLHIASTLRDMGRLADAANTYARYLAEPPGGAERVGDVQQLLLELDRHLAVLDVRVVARGSHVSIDGGPEVAVGSTLVTRVRPGLHLIRGKHGTAITEVALNAFEGEDKDVPLPAGDADSAQPAVSNKLASETTLPDRIVGWLITGTQYTADSATARARRVRVGYGGPEVAPIMPLAAPTPADQLAVTYDPTTHISSGVIALTRIVPFGDGTGAAVGLGFAYTPIDRVELVLEALRSQAWGAYVGGRYRLLLGALRPYVGAGLPMFEFVDDASGSTTVALGARGEAGVEYRLLAHLSIAADLGIEHYFSVGNKRYMDKTPDATLFAPTIAVVGRL